MRPAADPTLSIERCRQLVQPERPVEIVLQIIFARPDDFHRCLGRLSHEHRFRDEVVLQPPAEAATHAS